MAIPFMLIAGGVMALASRSVNNDVKNEIDSISYNIDRIINETNKLAETEMELFQGEVKKNEAKKDGIVEYLVVPFIDEFKKIKDCNLRERINIGHVNEIMKINEGGYAIKTYYNESSLKKVTSSLTTAAILSKFGIVGVTVSGFIEFDKLNTQKIVAEGKLEEAKLESEQIKNQIAAMKEMREQVSEITTVLSLLEKILRKAYVGFMNIIATSGYDYKMYSLEERKNLMMIVDIYNAVNSIIIKPIIREDGTFNQELINNSILTIELIESNQELICTI